MGNLKSIKDPVLLPIGLYSGVIVEAEARISASGSPMIAGTFEVRDGRYAGEQVAFFIITEAECPGAVFGRPLLKGLGVDVSREFDDDKVAKALVGHRTLAGIKGL